MFFGLNAKKKKKNDCLISNIENLVAKIRSVKFSFLLSIHFTAIKRTIDDLSCLNPLPDDKILNWSKLKQNADDSLRCIQNVK